MLKKLLSFVARKIYFAAPVLARIYLALMPALVALWSVWHLIVQLLRKSVYARSPSASPRRRRHAEPMGLGSVRRLVESGYLPRGGLRQHLANVVYAAGNYFMGSGDLPAARLCFEFLLTFSDRYSPAGMRYFRSLGATCFNQGDLEAAHAAFRQAGKARRVVLAGSRGSREMRLLGGSWFVAFGHIAMLDFYFKQRLLGWAPEVPHVLMTHDLGKLPNKILLHQFVKLGIQCISDGRQFASFYDQHKLGNELPWGQLPLEERLALTDDFWTYDFPDGEILTYTHGAARIQQQWEAQKRAPLMQLDEQQKLAARTLLDQMGVPRDAWFVCVHVREGGFYKNWNHKYPSARDGTIEDFYPAIKAIVDRGGWVVRMGDRSMTPLRPMERVVDYAHGPFKCEIGDIVLAASAKFLLGTNSGFATLPGIYGVPNVLTNWVPIQLPLWFGQDLMTPKLMWNREEERYLSFEEMFSTRLGATQNVREFPHQIEVRSNTSDEICAVAMEMLDRLDGKIRYSPADEAPQRAYFDIAERHGSYRGSRIGRDFLASYRKLLPDGSKPPVAKLTTDVAA